MSNDRDEYTKLKRDAVLRWFWANDRETMQMVVDLHDMESRFNDKQ